MLTPEYIEKITKGSEFIADQIRTEGLKRVLERLMARLNDNEFFFSQTDRWQILAMQDARLSLEDITRIIGEHTGLMETEIWNEMLSACIEATSIDNKIFKQANIETTDITRDPYALRLLERNYEKTIGTWKNFTGTMPLQTYNAYIEACDKAYNLVTGGLVSYTDAVKQACDVIVNNGVKCIEYPSGHKDTPQVATLRAVRTGINQSAGDITMARLNEYDWDIVLVSAHLGARYGDGGNNPSNHAWWQGKFYSRSGESDKFKDFYEATGYGTGEGLCGWNCRHSFGAGDGINNPYEKIDTEENKKAYDLSQKQRYLERQIRAQKDTVTEWEQIYKGTTRPKEKKEAHKKWQKARENLYAKNKNYNDFCDENGLTPFYERL